MTEKMPFPEGPEGGTEMAHTETKEEFAKRLIAITRSAEEIGGRGGKEGYW